MTTPTMDPTQTMVGTANGVGIWVAPASTVPPADIDTAFAAPWLPLGYASDDGVVLGGDTTTESFCLAHGEMILMADGTSRDVAQIKLGDRVASLDERLDTDAVYRTGTVTHSTATPARCVRVTLSDDTAIVCTENHPFVSEDDRGHMQWVRADSLDGRKIIGADGYAAVLAVESVGERVIQSISTDSHTYIGARGWWMHNTPWQSRTPIRSVITEKTKTIGFTMWQLNQTTLGVYFMEEITGTGDEFDFEVRSDSPQRIHAIGVDAQDGDRRLRIISPRATLDSTGDLTLTKGAMVPLEVTLSALDDAGVLWHVWVSGAAPTTLRSEAPAGGTRTRQAAPAGRS